MTPWCRPQTPHFDSACYLRNVSHRLPKGVATKWTLSPNHGSRPRLIQKGFDLALCCLWREVPPLEPTARARVLASLHQTDTEGVRKNNGQPGRPGTENGTRCPWRACCSQSEAPAEPPKAGSPLVHQTFKAALAERGVARLPLSPRRLR
jgi:hypothetical protein